MEKIPIIEPIKERKDFKNPDEFTVFYNQNKQLFEENTTCKLNKMFNIPGYRITKLKGVVSLKNIPESRVTCEMKVTTVEERLKDVEDKMNNMIKTMNTIIDKVNKIIQEFDNLSK